MSLRGYTPSGQCFLSPIVFDCQIFHEKNLCAVLAINSKSDAVIVKHCKLEEVEQPQELVNTRMVSAVAAPVK